MTDFNVRIALLREVERVRTNYYAFWRWVFLFFAAACEVLGYLVVKNATGGREAVRAAGWLWVAFSVAMLGFALFCHLAVCSRNRNTYRRNNARA